MEYLQHRLVRSHNFYVTDCFAACAKQFSCLDFKPVKRGFETRTKNAKSWHFVHEHEPPAVELGLLDSQRVSVRFGHDTTLPIVKATRRYSRLPLFFQTHERNSNVCLRRVEAKNKDFS
jgi:hypothetical protein